MPIELTCGCGRALAVADQLAGRTVKCPACGAAVTVPPVGGAAAAGTELEPPHDEHAVRKAARREARAAKREHRKGRRRSSRHAGRREAAEDKSPAAAAGTRARGAAEDKSPAAAAGTRAGAPAGGARCPSCNAPLAPNAVLCTQCGAGLRTGGMLLGDERRSSLRDILRSVGGPALAVAIVVGLVVAWRCGAFSKDFWRKPPSGGTAAPSGAEAGPAGPDEPGALPVPSFTGGTVSGSREIAAGSPCEVAETVVVPEGAELRLVPGAALRGPEGVELRVTGGSLIIEGLAEKPVVVCVPVVVSGASGSLRARHVLFARGVAIEGAGSRRVERATFMRGLRLAAKEAPGTSEWAFLRCELRPSDGKEGPCLEVDLSAPADRLKVSLKESNLRGGVAGKIGPSSRLDLSGNHWSGPVAEALDGIEARGGLSTEPVLSKAVPDAGAAAAAVETLLPREERGVLVNRHLGFEITPPEGWRAAGNTMLLAPEGLPRSTRIQIERRPATKALEEMRKRLVLDVKASGVRSVDATPGEEVEAAGAEALAFTCTFEAGRQRWARRHVIVRAKGVMYVITLNARADDVEALAAAFDEAVRSFRIFAGE